MKNQNQARKGSSTNGAGKQSKTSSKQWWSEAIRSLTPDHQKLVEIASATLGLTPEDYLKECVEQHLAEVTRKKLEAEAMFNSLDTIASYFQILGQTWQEDIGFKGQKLFWTDGETMWPITIKQAIAWWVNMDKKSSKYPRNKEPDNAFYPKRVARFMAMIAKAL